MMTRTNIPAFRNWQSTGAAPRFCAPTYTVAYASAETVIGLPSDDNQKHIIEVPV